MRSLVLACFVVTAATAALACNRTPSEPEGIQGDPSPAQDPAASANGDPRKGVWTLADATKDLPGTGTLYATIDTSNGALSCKLYDDKAPVTVANFVGLARGLRPWQDPATKQWVTRPAYDGTPFHRIVKGFMIQGGDSKGNGSGEAGYVIKDEVWPGAKHDRAGLICMANRGPNTNSAQFFITDAAAPHLDSGYTIFGECSPEATIHAIAAVPVRGETPVSKVTINSITITHTPPVLAPLGPLSQGPATAGSASDAGAKAPKPTVDAGK